MPSSVRIVAVSQRNELHNFLPRFRPAAAGGIAVLASSTLFIRSRANRGFFRVLAAKIASLRLETL